MTLTFPPLIPPLILRGGHRQTLWAFLSQGVDPRARETARRHPLDLPDGDRLILHDDCPPGWGPGHPFVLLLHGLAGGHDSAYLVRMMMRLTARGVRVFRLDHRGAGAGAGLARRPYHAGCSPDVRLAFHHASSLCNGSLGGLVGFSLSGNMVLKMLGEDARAGTLPRYLVCAAAVNPPIDLEQCSQALQRRSNRLYERHFTRLLHEQVEDRLRVFPDAPRPLFTTPPQQLREFDDGYTAPVSGFASVADYYERCSGIRFVPSIQTPTLILTAADDPLIPVQSFQQLPALPNLHVHIARHGGHLGYIARRGCDPDNRWMDWRLLEWLSAHLRFPVPRPESR